MLSRDQFWLPQYQKAENKFGRQDSPSCFSNIHLVQTPLQLRPYYTPPIQRNRRPVDITPCPRTQPNTRPRHILRTPDPPQRNAPLNHILELLQRRLHHLALERPASNRVAGNPPLAQMTSQHTAHVVQSGFGGGVGEGLERGDAQAVDGADVDDARG
jgi:hypothetical protein